MTDLTVFVVDDHAMVRKGLRAFLETEHDMSVIGEAADGRQALDSIAVLANEGTLPAVVLMDLLMPELDGVSTIVALRERYPHIKIVALTSSAESAKVNAALQAGVDGYLLKNSEPEQIVAAVRSADRGQAYIDPQIAAVVARSLRGSRQPVLSERELEVVALVGKGLSNQEIADQLFISERTARTHVSHVISKLGLSSRIQVALWAIREGLITVA